MNRQEKQNLLEKLGQVYGENQFVFLVSMKAVNAANTMQFRVDVRKINSTAIVVKNTLSRIASKQVGLNNFDKYFNGQILTIFTNDAVEFAKLIENYGDKGYAVVAGSDKINVFSAEDVKKLAKLPAMPIIRSMILSSILGVHTKTVRVLSESAASLVRLIAAAKKQ